MNTLSFLGWFGGQEILLTIIVLTIFSFIPIYLSYKIGFKSGYIKGLKEKNQKE